MMTNSIEQKGPMIAFQSGQIKQVMTDCLTTPAVPKAVHSRMMTMNSDSKLWVPVMPLITLTPDDREREIISEILDINVPFIWHIAQDDFTADKTNNMKHTTKYFNRGHPVVCHFTVKLKIPSKHNTLLETNVGN